MVYMVYMVYNIFKMIRNMTQEPDFLKNPCKANWNKEVHKKLIFIAKYYKRPIRQQVILFIEEAHEKLLRELEIKSRSTNHI